MSWFLSAIFTLYAATAPVAQPPVNLVVNSSGEFGPTPWQAQGNALVEEFDGDQCFVVRNGGKFVQSVSLPPAAAAGGRFVLFVAHVSSDRAATDITDRAYLYGLTYTADGKRILSHHQGPLMSGNAQTANQWTTAWGVFPIPENASSISYQLGQGSRKGVPHTGAAARFDDIGLFVFETRADAEAFVSRYR